MFGVSLTLKRLPILVAILIALAACSSNNSPPVSATNLPPGDASRGATLFTQAVNGAPSCSTCHTLDDQKLVGPGMAGYGARAGSRVSGKSAEDYTVESITSPAAHIVPDYPNVMYNGYGRQLTPQDIADLTAYLLTL